MTIVLYLLVSRRDVVVSVGASVSTIAWNVVRRRLESSYLLRRPLCNPFVRHVRRTMNLGISSGPYYAILLLLLLLLLAVVRRCDELDTVVRYRCNDRLDLTV